ncbi:SDR family NAD(P)-dependent oxidoreductase [Sphingomonas elodea]|uniref:SDR family NAD(P)-dependent oxidoreductase n=1 Tax=Sphingomonas elodea TaxID=179878 RepID=UPI000C1F3080
MAAPSKAAPLASPAPWADARGLPGLGAYHASKWAVEGLSEALSQELAGTKVRLTPVEPGPTRSIGREIRPCTPCPSKPMHRCGTRCRPARRRCHPNCSANPKRQARRSSRSSTPTRRRYGCSSASCRP